MKKLCEIFTIKNSQNLALLDCDQIKNGIPFVARSSKDNGITARIEQVEGIEPMPPGAITVALSGSVLSSFYQEEPFYTAFHVASLYPKKTMSTEQMLFYACVIEKNKYRYSYGRQANITLKDIMIPDIDELPNYVSTISYQDYKADKKPIINKKIKLNTDNWKWFRYDEIFIIKGSKTTSLATLNDIGKGKYPYVTTKATNNGVENYFDLYTEQGNVFTVDSAVAGFCTYQEKDFSASDHVEKLIPLFICNKYIALFLTTLINIEQYRYNYGRKCSQTALKQSKIKLPTTPDGAPDWLFMEDYIKSLPYSRGI